MLTVRLHVGRDEDGDPGLSFRVALGRLQFQVGACHVTPPADDDEEEADEYLPAFGFSAERADDYPDPVFRDLGGDEEE